MERKQFTFYKSFAEAIRRIRKTADRCAAYDALVGYALYGEMPDLEKAPDAVALLFEMAKPTMDASKRKAENGMRGGRKDKSASKAEADGKQEEGESKPEANAKQTESKKENEKEAEKENEIEIEKEKEVENECSIPIPPPPSRAAPFTISKQEEMIAEALVDHSPGLVAAVGDWAKYKAEKREGYKETGFKALLTQIRKNAELYGDEAMAEVIAGSMSANYQGIVFDWLKRRRPKGVDMDAKYRMIQEWGDG